ncbi:hypothetical protein [Pseudochelatococcus sp. G4_1912]|uniref:hypothetical protein n=1 Tax=Pseudochelatococcus sp. G4_1912 TaxID=3114288 RepID=UPI0039C693D4
MNEFHGSPEVAALGVKLVHLIAGVAGGIVRSLAIENYSIMEATSAVVVGGLTAGYGTPAATSLLCKWLHSMGFHAVGLDGAVGFMLGLCGMTIAEITIRCVKKWMRSTGLQT